MILPCNNDSKAVDQIHPAIDLLRTLDETHPDVLKAHGLTPADYHPKLVFRSAVESIRGTYIASSLTQRQGLVAGVLALMQGQKLIVEHRFKGSSERFDFEVMVRTHPQKMCAIEVKGGEGNSINISDRPLWANEFVLWCHLDGAIVNEPSHGVTAIINRVSNEMVKRGKLVDAIIFKDVTCNTPLRPCPKYRNKTPPSALGVAPDIFLLPRQVPSEKNPKPLTHELTTTMLPAKILSAHGVSPKDFETHIWRVTVKLTKNSAGRSVRETQVFHKGLLVGEGKSSR